MTSIRRAPEDALAASLQLLAAQLSMLLNGCSVHMMQCLQAEGLNPAGPVPPADAGIKLDIMAAGLSIVCRGGPCIPAVCMHRPLHD